MPKVETSYVCIYYLRKQNPILVALMQNKRVKRDLILDYYKSNSDVYMSKEI
jgi:hypothetical protein